MSTCNGLRSVKGWYAFTRWSHLSADLSPDAKKRLAWFDHHRRSKNVALTCRHFGISRKTFYYWQKRYAPHRLSSLEAKPSIPHRRRQRTVTQEQEMRRSPPRNTHR